MFFMKIVGNLLYGSSPGKAAFDSGAVLGGMGRLADVKPWNHV
jgi:hypothetical protein